MKALSLHITGVVQGVGFRPFVYTLARELGLDGWVLNSSDGVFCLVQGEPKTVEAFTLLVRERAPAMAVVESVITEEVEPESLVGFEIRESSAIEGAMTLVSPDIATCAACEHELFDPADRRCRYPFINCTNCGPRFTIIDDVPYDRPMTSMADFPMCPECAAEYADPADRRFHAQPDACFVCGPRLYLNVADEAAAGGVAHSNSPRGGPAVQAERALHAPPAPSPAAELVDRPLPLPPDARWDPSVEVSPRPHRDRDAERLRSDAIVAAAAQLLLDGHTLAIKGLGGFHLACDATNEDAVARLRERKNRWGKPLAIMVPDLETARAFCEIGPEEEALLTGTVRPIVLLRLKRDATSSIAPSVTGDLVEMGVMLPYTPLHHLLLDEVGRPLVMTSGNLSEEPIAMENAEALERLGAIADAFLLHDRGIYSRYDDSVVRVVERVAEPVRRSRGYAPFPLTLPFASDVDILAVGPEQKNTFTLATGEYAFVSQHIGDMENAETLESFGRTIELYERLFRIRPEIVAHDLHPEYLSTKYAMALDLPKVGVQHHHAHVASVSAEHGVSEPVVGIAFDGTGYGSDGRIWGGEVLVADWASFERAAHLAYVPMPGGAAAIRRPARMAIGTLSALGLLDHPGAEPLRSRLADGEEALLLRMIERGVNTPLTSSMGRLFDTVAAIVGVRDDARYEGEAAIELEAAADAGAQGAYEFTLRPGLAGEPTIIDPTSVLSAVVEDVAVGTPAGVVSMRFHRAVVRCIVMCALTSASSAGTRRVALGGGVFMNRLVLGGSVRDLRAAGLEPLTHLRLPANDGAVSFGQAVVAWAQRHEI